MMSHRSAASTLAVLLGGCVVPIAPQFDDEANSPPYVESSSPAVGDIITLRTRTEQREISATLSDQNLTDSLYVRWLIDYPSGDSGRTLTEMNLAGAKAPARPSLPFVVSCSFPGGGTLAPGLHRLVMSVSDRPFQNPFIGQDVDPEGPLDTPSEKANRIRVVWILSCP